MDFNNCIHDDHNLEDGKIIYDMSDTLADQLIILRNMYKAE